MRRRPVKRAAIITLVGILLVLAGITAQAGWLFVLAAGSLGLVAGSWLVPLRLKDVAIERSLPAAARVGDEVRVSMALHNASERSLPLMRIEDRYEAFGPILVTSEPVPPGETATIQLTRRARRRGVFEGGEVSLTCGPPFGLMRARRVAVVESPAVIVPRWAELTSFPILEPSSSPSDILHERARTGAGEEYAGVREYRPGDPPRFVHWRSTARAGRLIVREYEEEASSRVGLVISGRDVSVATDDDDPSPFEMLISAAASIALYALVTGHPVDLMRPVEQPSRGATRTSRRAVERPDRRPAGERLDRPGKSGVLEWLAATRAIDAPLEPLVAELIRALGRRSTIVVLVPSGGEAAGGISGAVRQIQAAGCRAFVVVADSSTWSSKEESAGRVTEGLGGGRAPLRVISRGDDLSRCLQT